jgi:hypothetical protein
MDYESLCSPILKKEDKIPEIHNFDQRIILEIADEEESGHLNPVKARDIYADIGYQLIEFMNHNPAFREQIIQTLPSQTLKAMGALVASELERNRWLKVLEERKRATSAEKYTSKTSSSNH